MCSNRVADVGSRALTFDFGMFLFLNEEYEVGRLHGCPRWLTMQCNEKRRLPSPLNPPASRYFPKVLL